ncbi:hypothetical protein [Nocardia arizonensis]|uniref:hypothetical protein n=1 Tax=Nocardia arizonensis TaxID=1141647 RepID=UPI0006D0E33D|nr:hypothetical protein [Nocardia arizonensis]
MISASCKLPWDAKNAALIKGDEVWHTDWSGQTLSIAEWVGRNFTGNLPSWKSVDAAMQLPWSTKNAALFNGDQVWHTDWPGQTLTIADWASRNFTGKLPDWSRIDASCKLPWDEKNAALFNGDQVWHTDWPGHTVDIGEWVGRNFTGHFPSWNRVDAAMQLPWSTKNAALINGNQVWHTDWPAQTQNLATWVRTNFGGSLPNGWN